MCNFQLLSCTLYFVFGKVVFVNRERESSKLNWMKLNWNAFPSLMRREICSPYKDSSLQCTQCSLLLLLFACFPHFPFAWDSAASSSWANSRAILSSRFPHLTGEILLTMLFTAAVVAALSRHHPLPHPFFVFSTFTCKFDRTQACCHQSNCERGKNERETSDSCVLLGYERTVLRGRETELVHSLSGSGSLFVKTPLIKERMEVWGRRTCRAREWVRDGGRERTNCSLSRSRRRSTEQTDSTGRHFVLSTTSRWIHRFCLCVCLVVPHPLPNTTRYHLNWCANSTN